MCCNRIFVSVCSATTVTPIDVKFCMMITY